MQIEFTAFGFKYGILTEADIVFDVRCLENPFYISALRDKTGEDKEVRDYIMSFPETDEVLKRIRDYLEYTIPLYEKKGKERLIVAFGCTGGQHRSVTCAYVLREYFAARYPHIRMAMRDMDRNQKDIAGK